MDFVPMVAETSGGIHEQERAHLKAYADGADEETEGDALLHERVHQPKKDASRCNSIRGPVLGNVPSRDGKADSRPALYGLTMTVTKSSGLGVAQSGLYVGVDANSKPTSSACGKKSNGAGKIRRDTGVCETTTHRQGGQRRKKV